MYKDTRSGHANKGAVTMKYKQSGLLNIKNENINMLTTEI